MLDGDDALAEGAKRVLFICTHNATRSPMAAGLVASLGKPGAMLGRSAGVYPGAPVDPLAVAAMAELGVDIAGHRSASLMELEAQGEDIGAYAAVIALSESAAQAASDYLGADCELWPTEDPTRIEGEEAARLEAYRRIRDGLANRIRMRFDGAIDG